MAIEKLPELTAKDQVVALVAEDCIDTAIATLNDKYRGLKADTEVNYQLVKKGYGEFVNRRTSIEKRRLSLKRDVDAEAARITKLLAPVEAELKTEKDKYEEAEKVRKAEIAAAKALAERIRIDKIKVKIAGFSNLAQGLMSKNAATLKEDLNFFQACVKDDNFNYEEFLNEAEKVKFETENAIAKAYKEREELEDREAEITRQKEAIAAQQAIIDEANRIVAEKAAADKLEQEKLLAAKREKEQEELRAAQAASLSAGVILIDDPIAPSEGISPQQIFSISNLAIAMGNAYSRVYDSEPQNIENIHIGNAADMDKEEEDTLTELEVEICESRVIAGNMRNYGGGFVKKLGEALFLADRFNTQRIKNAFPEYWNQYLNWGK